MRGRHPVAVKRLAFGPPRDSVPRVNWLAHPPTPGTGQARLPVRGDSTPPTSAPLGRPAGRPPAETLKLSAPAAHQTRERP